MRNKRIYASLSLVIVSILILTFYFYYPFSFKCGSGKRIEKNFFTVNIYGEKDIKDAECRRKSFFQPVYECTFTFQNKKLDIIIDDDLYVVFELPFKKLNNDVFNLCDGKVLSQGGKHYCILYRCRKL